MHEIRVLKKYSFQPAYSFRLFIPFNVLLNNVKVIVDKINSSLLFPINAVFKTIGGGFEDFLMRVQKIVNLLDDFDLNLLCKSVSGIPGLTYDYTTVKFLKENIIQLSGYNTENKISFTFYCDDNFFLYEIICLWCDIIFIISTLNFDVINLFSFVSLLSLYKIDCETPSKVFRFWGLRPVEKPNINDLNRDNIDNLFDLKVDFIFNEVERMC